MTIKDDALLAWQRATALAQVCHQSTQRCHQTGRAGRQYQEHARAALPSVWSCGPPTCSRVLAATAATHLHAPFSALPCHLRMPCCSAPCSACTVGVQCGTNLIHMQGMTGHPSAVLHLRSRRWPFSRCFGVPHSQTQMHMCTGARACAEAHAGVCAAAPPSRCLWAA